MDDVRNRKDPLSMFQAGGNQAWDHDGNTGTKVESRKSEPVNRRVRAAYGHFAETTTFGGVIHTFVSPNPIWKGVWVLVVLTLIGATLWNTIQVVQDYLSFPVTTKVQVGHQASVPFPTVTVCNRNPVQCTKLALAYVKYPEELNDLMFYSNCKATLGVKPLLSRLIAGAMKDTRSKGWLDDLEVRTKFAISVANTSNYWVFLAYFGLPAEAPEVASCWEQVSAHIDELTSDGTTMEDVLEAMADFGCNIDLTKVLFNQVVDPKLKPNATSSDAGLVASPNATNTTGGPAAGGSATLIQEANPTGGPSTQTAASTEEPETDDGSPYSDDDLNAWLGGDGEQSQEVADTEKFITEFSSIAKNRSQLPLLTELVGDDFRNFIANCTYFGRECATDSLFVLDFVPEYGACYTFNSPFEENNGSKNGTSSAGKRRAILTGALYGLSLEVVLDQGNYLPQMAASGAGVRVTITPTGDRPNPADEGYFVRPNSEADFAFRVQMISRQPDPYTSQCWGDWSRTPYQPLFYSIDKNKTQNIEAYSYTECRQACSSYLMAKHCKCVDPRKTYPFLMNGNELTATTRVCDLTDKKDQECRLDVLLKMESNESFSCDCHPPCDEKEYVTTVSTAEWPSKSYASSIMKKYRAILDFLSGGTMEGKNRQQLAEDLFEQEFAKINVYAQTMNVEQISEEAKYDISQLLSALGGALGLYTGFCGVTLIEIAELLILLIAATAGYNIVRNE